MMRIFYRFLVIMIILGIFVTGCTENANISTLAPTLSLPEQTVEVSATAPPEQPLRKESVTPEAAAVNNDTAVQPTAASATKAVTAAAVTDWKTAPVLPEIGPRAQAILLDGLAKGNNPDAFSKIGDCESQASWFLGDFDLDPDHYSLGPYEKDLRPVIDQYQGSYSRVSLAARQGFTAASLMSSIWADRTQCEKGETPLACEYRLHKPSVAFILIGTNDAVNPKTFEGHMRKVIEFSIEQGVLPVLGTKADNIEGDHQINASIVRLASEYDLPLWNYWLAVQDLPGHGLQEDGAHLTFAAPRFDNPRALKNAWPVRNLNALQILERVMSAVEENS